MQRALSCSLLALACLALAPAANAQFTYNVAVPGAYGTPTNVVVTGTITTNALGTLTTANFTDYNITFTSPTETNILTPANSTIDTNGAVVTGTASDLSVDLGPGYTFLSISESFPSGSAGFVYQNVFGNKRLFVENTSNFFVIVNSDTYNLPATGPYVFATATPAAVPEPGSIALLAGMTLSGAAFLRRRKAVKNAA